MEYVDFKDEDELLDFLYNDATMEIFGQAKEIENSVISHLVELYKGAPDNYVLRIVSDELGKSKPSTLWFLAKYGLVCDEIIFYTKTTVGELWENTDVFITADIDIIENMVSDLRIKSIKEINSFKDACEEIVTV